MRKRRRKNLDFLYYPSPLSYPFLSPLPLAPSHPLPSLSLSPSLSLTQTHTPPSPLLSSYPSLSLSFSLFPLSHSLSFSLVSSSTLSPSLLSLSHFPTLFTVIYLLALIKLKATSIHKRANNELNQY